MNSAQAAQELQFALNTLSERHGPQIYDALLLQLQQKREKGVASQVVTYEYLQFILDPFNKPPVRGPCLIPHPTHIWKYKGQTLLQHGTKNSLLIQIDRGGIYNEAANAELINIFQFNTNATTATNIDVTSTKVTLNYNNSTFEASRLLSYGLKITYVGSNENAKGIITTGNMPGQLGSSVTYSTTDCNSDAKMNTILDEISDSYGSFTTKATNGIYYAWLPHFEEEFEFRTNNSQLNSMTYAPVIYIYGLPTSTLENGVILLEYIFHFESIPQKSVRDIFPGEYSQQKMTPKEVAQITRQQPNFVDTISSWTDKVSSFYDNAMSYIPAVTKLYNFASPFLLGSLGKII